jgi:uncharacterized LabA/DUF88 family protein
MRLKQHPCLKLAIKSVKLMPNNYFFIEGSALTAQIRVLRRADRSFQNCRLIPSQLIAFYCRHLVELGVGDFKRATFYFPQGDEVAIQDYLMIPEYAKPGEVRDLHFKFCGQKLKGSGEFTAFVESTVPPKWRDRFSKSEKGVDIQICCDALKLASASRIDRLMLFTNDDDFIPLCDAVKEFGANISIIHLTDYVAPNVSLCKQADSYDVIPRAKLQHIFTPTTTVETEPTESPTCFYPSAPLPRTLLFGAAGVSAAHSALASARAAHTSMIEAEGVHEGLGHAGPACMPALYADNSSVASTSRVREDVGTECWLRNDCVGHRGVGMDHVRRAGKLPGRGNCKHPRLV